MTKPGRIPCVVPFCRRTADEKKLVGCSEIICGKHARMAPRTLRLRYRKLQRRYRKNLGGLEGVKLARILDKLWERYKRAAIEAAAGL